MDALLDLQALQTGIRHFKIDRDFLKLNLAHWFELQNLLECSVVLVKLRSHVLQEQLVEVLKLDELTCGGGVETQVLVGIAELFVV